MNIYQAIRDVMNDVGALGKNRKNQQQGFMYRGVDDVMNALQPAFIKHNLFVIPEVLEQTREERTTTKGAQLLYSILKVKFTFYADDGSHISATVIGEGMDSADKASNKAMSVAFKYACFQVFCIPTEEMVDPDAETPPSSKPIRQAYDNSQQPSANVEYKSSRILQLEHVIKDSSYTMEKAHEYARKKFGNTVDGITDEQYNDLFAALSTAVHKEKGNG